MTSILLIGSGRLGGALRARWLAHSDVQVWVVDPQARDAFASLEEVPEHYAPHIIVIAVKPQQIAEVLPAYGARFGAQALYVSVAAGKTIATLTALLGTDARVVRAMPNLPASVGKAMTVLVAAPSVSQAERGLAEQLMQAVGETAWITDEEQMHLVTAVSGSGPAYFFLLAEAMREAAIEQGLSEELVAQLVRTTLAGAGAMMEDAINTPAALIAQVASPGGTTEAALAAFHHGQLPALVAHALHKAAARSAELSE